MGTSYVFSHTYPSVTFTALTATPQNFTVNMLDMDTLILDIDFTRVAGTAVVITLRGLTGLNDSTNVRTFLITDYSAKTLTDATFTWTTSVSGRRIATFSLTGLDTTVSSQGNVQVSVSATAGTTDSITITPMTARTG